MPFLRGLCFRIFVQLYGPLHRVDILFILAWGGIGRCVVGCSFSFIYPHHDENARSVLMILAFLSTFMLIHYVIYVRQPTGGGGALEKTLRVPVQYLLEPENCFWWSRSSPETKRRVGGRSRLRQTRTQRSPVNTENMVTLVYRDPGSGFGLNPGVSPVSETSTGGRGGGYMRVILYDHNTKGNVCFQSPSCAAGFKVKSVLRRQHFILQV